ncbi:MAG: 23S rRNA (adenine(2503)-C(2))-methyltransferase RlmN [Deltaproteobacteria bacterium]|nr:23S rRNA (adenine(2503)-C(2))-methyltransferase RlmN [Deltaproteobacteria bacterium]
METIKTDIMAMSVDEIEEWASGMGLEAYRGRQIRHWLMKRLARSFDEMTDIKKPLRLLLKESADFDFLEKTNVLLSQDGTEKYLFRLRDGNMIEAVHIHEKDHSTLCISSQAGCAMGCRFCLTGRQGLKRNLTASEILEQVIQVKRSVKEPERLTNIVLMGMGEPLANYRNVLKAVGNLISSDGMNLSHRKITLSTCGLIPEMKRLGRDIGINLAVSLNAADDETRSYLMPVNRKYPLSRLIKTCREFPLPNRRMITFEYILIRDINDREKDAINLCSLLSDMRAKINLIPFNQSSDSDMAQPSMEKILNFQKILLDNNFTAIIRKSKGRDIMAACGQLAGQAAAS